MARVPGVTDHPHRVKRLTPAAVSVWLLVGIVLFAGWLVMRPVGLPAEISRRDRPPRSPAEISRRDLPLDRHHRPGCGAITAVNCLPYYSVWSRIHVATAAMVVCGLAAHDGMEAATT
jgi:hypothetical protein